MLELSNIERAYFQDSFALALDDDGDECLAGLTVSESNFYLAFRRQPYGLAQEGAEIALYLRFLLIHENARLVAAARARRKTPASRRKPP